MGLASASGTIVSQTGPALATGTIPFSNVERIELNFQSQIGRIEWNTAQGVNKFIEWDLSLTTTLTDTITNFAHVFTISGT